MFGTWMDYRTPTWETYLESTPQFVIDQTGLTKEELKKVLEILHEHRVIN